MWLAVVGVVLALPTFAFLSPAFVSPSRRISLLRAEGDKVSPFEIKTFKVAPTPAPVDNNTDPTEEKTLIIDTSSAPTAPSDPMTGDEMFAAQMSWTAISKSNNAAAKQKLLEEARKEQVRACVRSEGTG